MAARKAASSGRLLPQEEAASLTVLHPTAEILHTSNRAVVLPLRFLQLHSSPETSRKLCAAAELQGSNLSTKREAKKTTRYNNRLLMKQEQHQITPKKNQKPKNGGIVVSCVTDSGLPQTLERQFCTFVY